MTGELPPAEAKMLEIVLAANHGDASNYPEHEVLTAIGAVFIARRRVDDPETALMLDQALELLAAEIEARVALRDSPLPDTPGSKEN
jgi:hypothetical protein